MSDPGLMPIGRLARLSRLTVRALRLYDEEGLLVPAWIDPDSGYRYYRAEQVRRATTIALLRSLGVGLETVRAVLDAADPGALAEVLAAERDRAERELEERRQAVRSIERLVQAPSSLPYSVAIAERPARRLVGLAARISGERLGPETGALCERAVTVLAAAGLAPADGLDACFPLDIAAEIEITVGASAARRVPVPDGTVERTLRGGPWASTIHVGHYDELPLAYAALLEHVRERGYEARSPIVETYLSDPRATAPAELVTRLAVGLET